MSIAVSSASQDADRDPPARDGHFVTSLERGLSVMRSFGRGASEMTLSEVARRTGLSRATARRFLLTLADLGYVAAEGRLFRLTPKVFDLGFAFLSSLDLWDVALPFMERVSDETGEACSATVLNRTEIVYTARIPSRRIMTISMHIGSRLPAYPTSMGRVLLAALSPADLDAYFREAQLDRRTAKTITDEARLRAIIANVARESYAVVDEELEEGLRSIAVPIRSKSGCVLAALNIGTHASRFTLDEMVAGLLPILRRASDSITGVLSG